MRARPGLVPWRDSCEEGHLFRRFQHLGLRSPVPAGRALCSGQLMGGHPAAETGWVLGNWGANGRELPDAAPDIPADTDLLIVMLGTNDLLQGRRPKATAERMERFLTGLELARGKIPLFALPSRSPREWVPGQMLIAASRTFAGCCRTLAGRWNVSPAYDGVPLRGAGAQGPCRRDFAP